MDISFLIFIVSKSPIIDADASLNVPNGFICNKTNSDTTDTSSSYESNTLQSLGKIICYKSCVFYYYFIICF